MKKYLALLLGSLALTSAALAQNIQIQRAQASPQQAPAQQQRPPAPAPGPKVVAFYSVTVESDHVLFAQDALHFFASNANKDQYTFAATTDWDLLNPDYLKNVKIVIWLNDEPHTQVQRDAFQHYMENGGIWYGFHVSAFNSRNDRNVWFRQFLGGGAFGANNWPPLPARVNVDAPNHPVMKGIPSTFIAPQTEWYSWTPSPRANKDVQVLLSLDKSNFPFGIKDVIEATDVPVVWTNTKYKMLYMNTGHGDKVFTDPVQNQLIENGLNWLLML